MAAMRACACSLIIFTLSILCASTEEVPGTCPGDSMVQHRSKLTKSKDCCDSLYCLAFGDPHFVTFDGASLRGIGKRYLAVSGEVSTFWLVKSDTLQIQGRSYGIRGIASGFAATGSFLNGHKLTLEMDASGITSKSIKGKITVTWDGKEVLANENDDFEVLGLVTLKRGTQLVTEEHLKDLGDVHKTEMKSHLIGMNFEGEQYHFTLPKGVQIFVDAVPKGWGVGVMIKMGACGGTPPLDNLQGWCGPTTQPGTGSGYDWRPSVAPVEADEDAFPKMATLVETDGSVTSDSEKCAGSMTKKQAKEACEIVVDLLLKKQCISDVCQFGDADAALEELVAEYLELENGRGIPVFVGNGRCLDHNGNQYTAFEKADITTAAGCKSALKQLAEVTAVRGSQLHKGHGCQILVDPGHAISTLTQASDGEGTALIVSVDEEMGYTCWRLN